METIRVLVYHTKEILKGKGLRVFLALFVPSIVIMLYMEGFQLSMDINGTAYMVVSLLSSLVNIVAVYIVEFVFIKVVRKEKFTFKDIAYGIKKSPIMIVLGLMLSFMQIAFIAVSSLLQGIYILYLLVYSLVYAFFLVWNALIAYGIYDGAGFSQLLSGGLFIVKNHIKEILLVAIPLMLWHVLGQLIVPSLTQTILGESMYAGLFIPGILKASAISTLSMIEITGLNLLYYGGQYLMMVPLYTYVAKLYNEDYLQCMPSGTRFLKEGK